MKVFLLLITLQIFLSCVSAQIIDEIPRDHNTNLLNVFWKLDKDRIITFNSDSNYFYRVVVISDGEGISQMEGEVLDRIYLLKGEYGEYPDGRLFDLGTFYNFISCEIKNDLLLIFYGAKDNEKTQTLALP